jgi:hypothetical protein
MVFREIGAQVLLHHLTTSLKSTDENVVLQVCSFSRPIFVYPFPLKLTSLALGGLRPREPR